jgi:hypothetical protein
VSPLPAAGVAPSACSAFSVRLDEPLAGTAPTASAWLAVEQPGPWGARALTESRLDPGLGAELNRRAQGTGVRIALIRPVGRHASAAVGARRVLIASTAPGREDLRSLAVRDPRDLLDLDFAALGSGRIDVGEPQSEPALLVCTNARRDLCCAVLGRSLARGLAEELRGGETEFGLWEADHLGGHRFAPTAAVLPAGYLYGRLDVASALLAVKRAAKHEVSLEHCRGRSTWSRPGQAAELAVRAQFAQLEAGAIEVVAEQETAPGRWSVTVRARGSDHRVLVERMVPAEPRPESCGKAVGNPPALRVVSIAASGEKPVW